MFIDVCQRIEEVIQACCLSTSFTSVLACISSDTRITARQSLGGRRRVENQWAIWLAVSHTIQHYKQDVDNGYMRDLCAKRIVALIRRGSPGSPQGPSRGSDKKLFLSRSFLSPRGRQPAGVKRTALISLASCGGEIIYMKRLYFLASCKVVDSKGGAGE